MYYESCAAVEQLSIFQKGQNGEVVGGEFVKSQHASPLDSATSE